MSVVDSLSRRASHPLALGLAGALIIAFSAVMIRFADVSPSTAAVFRCLYAIPPLALLAWRERRMAEGARIDRPSAKLAVWAGVAFAVDLVSWHYSIAAVGAGLATVLGNVQVVGVPLVAWLLLHERPSSRQLAMLPVALGGVVLIAGVFDAAAYGDDPAFGAIMGLTTAASYTAFILLLRQATPNASRPVQPLAIATTVACVGSAVAGIAIGDLDMVPSWPAHGWLLALALSCQVVAWLLISMSLARLPAVLTSLVLTVQPLGSLVLGAALLGERPSLLQLAGALLIMAAIVVSVRGADTHRR